MLLRALTVWLLLLGTALVLAVFREEVLTPRVGPQGSHLLGTALAVASMATVIGLSLPWVVPDLDNRSLWALGLGWTGLTVAFEFVFGHFVMGHPWSRLLHDYDLLAGRVWVLVLLTTLLAPVLLGRVIPRA
jgi:hypothetical protein